MNPTPCRFCRAPLTTSFVDLGMSPLSNSYLKADHLDRMEPYYPLHAFVCDACLLVQLKEYQSPEAIFSDYAYFSSYSDEWLKHCKTYVEAMTPRFHLDAKSQVVEIASNDGYLLQYFREKGVPVLGIEPAANVAKVAESKGIPSWVKFFGRTTAQDIKAAGKSADLLLGNNVLAHVPDINDFVAGLKIALKPSGVITMEFPHLLRLIEQTQFDTIYHEHFSYLSFLVVEKIFKSHGLTMFDVEEQRTHGGSLRIFAQHEGGPHAVSPSVQRMRDLEKKAGLYSIDAYSGFASKVDRVKRDLLEFLIREKRNGKSIAAYGAAAKGNTLLNHGGIRHDFLEYVVDANPHKQGRFLPGSHLPIFPPARLKETKPDFVLILPWNIKQEVVRSVSYIKDWGGKFVVAVPSLEVIG